MNNISKYLYNKFVPNPKRWYPIISVYYLNYSCDFKCSYCSDGSGVPYYKLTDIKVELNDAIEIIKHIRKYTDYFVLTGGEPLQYPEISELLLKIGELKFKNFILTTNGFYYDKYYEEISKSVNSLVFSLDSMNKEKAENLWGMPEATFDKIISNINMAHKIKSANTNIILSTVLTPSNIDDAYDVYKFACQNGFEFAACPQLMGVKANQELYGNKSYSQFYNYLIKEKKKGGKIFGSVKYLEYMRELKTFNCKPFTMLVVSPTGEIYYPCLEKGNPARNIKDVGNLHQAKLLGEEKYGQKPLCGNQCHSACALTFALL